MELKFSFNDNSVTQPYLHAACYDLMHGLWKEQPEHPRPVQRVKKNHPLEQAGDRVRREDQINPAKQKKMIPSMHSRSRKSTGLFQRSRPG